MSSKLGPVRKKHYKIGDPVTVHHCWGGYLLPEGLPEGATVKVVGMDIGYDDVEYQGRQFNVSMTNIDPGYEYLIDGKWLDEKHPAVVAEKQRLSTRS